MISKSIFHVVLYMCIVTSIAEASRMTPNEKKKNAGDQANTIKAISEEFKMSVQSIPTTKELEMEIQKDNQAEMKKYDDAIRKEKEIKPAFICEGPTYERDYDFECPYEWSRMPDGQCWGTHYRGPCDALHYFNRFDKDLKIKFEHDCCAYWPRKYPAEGPKEMQERLKLRKVALHEIRGPVEYSTGLIINASS